MTFCSLKVNLLLLPLLLNSLEPLLEALDTREVVVEAPAQLHSELVTVGSQNVFFMNLLVLKFKQSIF